MSKHTPGPWVVGEESFVERTGALDYIPVMKHNNGVIAFAYTNCLVKSDDRCRANARLIAASPDLFSAAHETVSALDDAYRLIGHDDDFIYDTLGSGLASAYFSARAAIAKVRGEA